MELNLTPEKTALVVIDLQKGIASRQTAPYTPADVIARSARLLEAFRAAGSFVVLVNVDSRDGKDMLRPITDAPASPAAQLPKDFAEYVPELNVAPTDHLLTKHNWGAFYGTDLDLQLRRRGIETIVLCGIATGIGVDTTAREAFQHGYQQVFVEDAMTGLSTEEHNHSVNVIFPRMGRVRSTEDVLAALSK